MISRTFAARKIICPLLSRALDGFYVEQIALCRSWQMPALCSSCVACNSLSEHVQTFRQGFPFRILFASDSGGTQSTRDVKPLHSTITLLEKE